MLALKELLGGGKAADTMDAGSAKPARRKSMVCLRMIPRNIVARKRSVFLDHHPLLTDRQDHHEDAPASAEASPGSPPSKTGTRVEEGRVHPAEEDEEILRSALLESENSERYANVDSLSDPRYRAVVPMPEASGTSTSTSHSTSHSASTATAASTSANTPTRLRTRGSETCSQDGRTQQVIPLQHGDSLNISDNILLCTAILRGGCKLLGDLEAHFYGCFTVALVSGMATLSLMTQRTKALSLTSELMSQSSHVTRTAT
ncbi:uncharacterized protein LOC122252514 [Penaeus japonicus]|uniref:uncharacterized protein LOC122252514 n=1 Tax=Penaeus japonicus TaxID=27405 RepID=UPI001C71577F|nr:uncharacterized protein LOC122252514 [Penaeus japonicus]